jgi:hypothetical protein
MMRRRGRNAYHRASRILEVVMLAPADALPLALQRAGEPRWRQAVAQQVAARQAVAQSVQDRRDVSEFDKPEIGRDAIAPYNHGGTVVVASAWLAFYVIAAIHHFVASGY